MASHSRRGLQLIGVMKLLKAACLVAAGVGLLSLFHRDAAETVRRWLEMIRIDPHDRLIDRFLEKVAGIDHRELRKLGVGTLLYAGVFTTEGVGLLLSKRWAEYMTFAVTISFLPLEVYEMVRHVSVLKGVVIVLNVAVVIYLALELRREHGSEPSTPKPLGEAPPVL